MTGNITPVTGSQLNPDIPKIPEIVLVDGKPVQMTLVEALSGLKQGDIVFKGANLLIFGNVEVFPYAAGGISGREGGISLVISGAQAEVQKVLDVVQKIQGGKTFHRINPVFIPLVEKHRYEKAG